MCAQCGTPGCPECLETVGLKLACRRCVDLLKRNLLAQPASPPSVRPLNPELNPNAGLNYASNPADYVNAAPPNTYKPQQMLMGVGLASVVGVIGAVGIEKLLFYGHFGLALLYIILGAAVGGCARAFTGRGGVVIATAALVVMAASLMISHLIYAQDIMTQAQASSDLPGGASLSSTFPIVMGQLKFIHWAFVAGGLFASVRIAGLK